LANLITVIGNFTESQAKAYIEALRAARRESISTHTSKKFLKLLSEIIILPGNEDLKLELQEEDFVLEDIKDWVTWALIRMGSIGSLVILGIYATASYARHIAKKSKKSITYAPIPNDVLREEPNGQNDDFHKTLTVPVDKAV